MPRKQRKCGEGVGQVQGKDHAETAHLFGVESAREERLYEYAREGKEVPKEIEGAAGRSEGTRDRELDGREGATTTVFPKKTRRMRQRILPRRYCISERLLRRLGNASEVQFMNGTAGTGTKRKRSLDDGDSVVPNKNPELGPEGESQWLMSGGLQNPDHSTKADRYSCTTELATTNRRPTSSQIAHDSDIGVLLRTRQGDFELGKNVLEYEDLEKGEDVWGPKVEQLLSDWKSSNEDMNGGADRSDGGRKRRRRNSSSDA
ncbi:hypothetical protein HO173_009895 [Letharia columbiana]|uniref:Uncharacterized protein n=1 Tax=Letharia columbiana TaxID=112416 RepID=A0A8H6L1B8_9LECA|nr:uncharacterized protein HO173_009895 [Letharia columbiana]KAF6231812.1 hypothetical protein HO173_009895 [Letharia columbiana]